MPIGPNLYWNGGAVYVYPPTMPAMPSATIGQPRALVRIRPMRKATPKAAIAKRYAARSVIRPFTIAWLARGETIVSTPLRTS